MKQEKFGMRHVTYEENGNRLLEDFNLHIFSGEITGIAVRKGHGAAALLKLIQRNLPLEDGYIYLNEKMINSWRESSKEYNKVTIIQSRSSLVEGMTVTENVYVLRNGFKQKIIHSGLLKKQLKPFLQELGVEICEDSYVEKLSYFERIIIEMIKGIIMQHPLIVLNEIDSLLSETEIKKLFEIMERYKQKSTAFLYISTFMEEVLELCDRTALLSDGRIQMLWSKEREKPLLTSKMNTYDSNFFNEINKENSTQIIVNIKKIISGQFQKLEINIGQGECVVIQNAEYQLFSGLVHLLTKDTLQREQGIWLNGQRVNLAHNQEIAVITEDPTESMIFSEMTYLDNLTMGIFNRIPRIWNRKRIEDSIRSEYKETLGKEVFEKRIDEITEKQKIQLIYMRILLMKPKLVFIIQPFKGMDLSHRCFIGERIKELSRKGIGVILITINISDTMIVGDRLIRINRRGEILEISREEFCLYTDK